MTDKELKDWCKTCNVEPPAMRFKCPECEHNPDKEQIMINGVDVNRCIDFNKRDKVSCYHILYDKCNENPNCYFKQLARKTQEFEQLEEKYEALKLENQEGYEIVAELKHECEELKKEIINKNEKIKELRLSVSDLTNRLCYLNAEKSFRIVDLEQALDEIEKELKEDIYCENQECGCDDFEECLKCTKEHILDIIKTIDE